jgi:hypothetical protein
LLGKARPGAVELRRANFAAEIFSGIRGRDGKRTKRPAGPYTGTAFGLY